MTADNNNLPQGGDRRVLAAAYQVPFLAPSMFFFSFSRCFFFFLKRQRHSSHPLTLHQILSTVGMIRLKPGVGNPNPDLRKLQEPKPLDPAVAAFQCAHEQKAGPESVPAM